MNRQEQQELQQQQPWDESARLMDVIQEDNNSAVYSDPLEYFEDDDGNWRSGITMGTFDSTKENSGPIVVIDVGGDEDPEAPPPPPAAAGESAPTSPPSRRRSSLKEFFEEERDAARRASSARDKEVAIGYNDETYPLTDDEIELFRGLVRKQQPLEKRGSTRSLNSTGSADTDIRRMTVKSKLSPDTFSFLVASQVRSAPFITGLFILFLKAGIFALIAANLVDTQDEGNPLGIPTSVPAPVIVGQFLALFIAVATQDDIVTALNLADEGYSSAFMIRAHPAASRKKWLIGITTLFLTGALGLAVTFMLVVTSSEVVDLMLNFTAIEFVSLLDNAAFILAKTGLLGLACKIKTGEIEDREYRVPKSREATPRKQIITLIVTFFLLVIGWVIIFYYQVTGRYTPQTIVVQFDDAVVLELGTYSGTYELHNEAWKLGFSRMRYDNSNGNGTFAFCESNEFWTFRIEPGDPCEDILVRSSRTQSFDITTTAESQWLATSDPALGRFFPMDIFHIALGCDLDQDCGGVGHGTCEDDRCFCNPGFFGTSCDFSEEATCEKMELDTESLSEQNVRRYATTYHVVVNAESGEKIEVYDRYVYASDFTSAQSADVLIYTGLRWVLAQMPAVLNATESNFVEVLSQDDAFVAQSFLASPSYLVSEPLLLNTHSDSAVPLNLQWFPVRVTGSETSVSLPVVVDLFCAICDDESNPCRYENTCTNDGVCQCTNGASGTLCQHTPTSDGNCDFEFFNKAAFNFDGGDCCETTCYNTGDNVCGVVQEHGVDQLFVGYLHCADSYSTSCETEDSCFKRQSESIASLSSYDEAKVTLSANGRVVAIAEPTLDSIRVFDNVDAGWTQRGPSLEGGRRTMFGRKVAMSKNPGEVVGRINNELPLVMAIGYGIEGQASVRVVRWSKSTVEWVVIASDIELCRGPGCDLTSLDVATDGERIVLAASSNMNNGTTVLFSTIVNQTFTGLWESVSTVNGTYVSLSESGRIAAVAETGTPTITRVKTVPSAADDNDDLVLSVHDLSAFGEGSIISGLKLSLVGDHISTHLEGTIQRSSLTRFHVSALSPRPHVGTQFSSYKVAPFVDFSDDGSIATVTGDQGGQHSGRVLKTFKFSQQEQQWSEMGSYVPVSTRAQEFAVSFDGGTFVVGGDSPTEVYKLAEPCNGTEVQLSLSLDSLPTNVSWEMRSFQYLGDIMLETETAMKTCDRCYKDSLFRGLVSYTECVPWNECLGFSFAADDGFQEGSGLVLFVNGQANITLNATHSDPVDLQIHNKESCQLDSITCDAGQALLTMIVQLDGNADETSWYLRDSTNKTLDEASYTNTQRDARQLCVPALECLVLTFEDTFGDGFCCNSGNGGYTLYLDGILVGDRSGDIGFGERLFFGNCESKVDHPVEAELVIEFDRKPNETSWVVLDIGERGVASGGPYVDFQDLVTDPIVFPLDCALIANVTSNFTSNLTETSNETVGHNSTVGDIVPLNATWGPLLSGFYKVLEAVETVYFESLNITSLTDLFACEPWTYDANVTNTTNGENATLETTFNETMCNATEDSIFDLCDKKYSLSELFYFFNVTLNVTELFEYKFVNLNQTNETDFDFGTALKTTETLHLYPDEVHTLLFEAGDGFTGSYQLLYNGEPIVNASNSPTLEFEISSILVSENSTNSTSAQQPNATNTTT